MNIYCYTCAKTTNHQIVRENENFGGEVTLIEGRCRVCKDLNGFDPE